MKQVQTVYACPNCGIENPPSHECCLRCGNVLPNWAGWQMYNIFFKKKSEELYKILLCGGPIFTLEDAWDAVKLFVPENHGRHEFFIGKYPVKVNLKGPFLGVNEWYQVDFRATPGNMGRKVIRIS